MTNLKKILDELKLLFEKRISDKLKDLESQSVHQTLSALSMASPFTIQENKYYLKQKIYDRKLKFEEILNTYNTDYSGLKTVQ